MYIRTICIVFLTLTFSPDLKAQNNFDARGERIMPQDSALPTEVSLPAVPDGNAESLPDNNEQSQENLQSVQAQKKKSQSEIYYNMATTYRIAGEREKMINFLTLAAQGQDDFAKMASRELIKEKARDGELSQPGLDKPADRKSLADGAELCFRETTDRKDCRERTHDEVHKLAEEQSAQDEFINRIRMAALSNTAGDYDRSLSILLPLFEKPEFQNNAAIGRAWFLAGEAFERASEYQDLYRARAAYEKAAASDGQFRKIASFRLEHLRRNLGGNFIQ
ncbi:MAG: hypothetical protein KDK41_02510 [Leptospiraceae bacterium]|nr:hypothetical protein [Leptospiraceae bacterium]